MTDESVDRALARVYKNRDKVWSDDLDDLFTLREIDVKTANGLDLIQMDEAAAKGDKLKDDISRLLHGVLCKVDPISFLTPDWDELKKTAKRDTSGARASGARVEQCHDATDAILELVAQYVEDGGELR
jgi:hypothetical protein